MTRQVKFLDDGFFPSQSLSKSLDPAFGGQFGYANDLSTLINNQAYMMNQSFAVVLEAPGFFDLFPDKKAGLIKMLRAFFETHVRSFEGLRGGLEVAHEAHPVGGAGEEQDEISNVTRAKSEPSVTVIDKLGRPFQKFLEFWIQYGMMDPDTKFALASMLQQGRKVWTSDMFTATVMFIEPDTTHSIVEKAYLCTNMMPKAAGDKDARRDLTAGREMLTLSIPFTAVTSQTNGDYVLAQEILNRINQINANPLLRPSFLGQDYAAISPDVNGLDQEVSYGNTIDKVVRDQVTLG